MLCTAPYRALQALVPPLDAPEQRLDRLRQFDAQLQYDECHGVRLSAFSARSCRPNRVPHRRAQAQSRLPLSGTGGAGAKRPGRHRARRYNRQGRESPPGSLLRLAARSPTPADGGSRSPNTRRRRITITPPKADHDHPLKADHDRGHQQRGEAAATTPTSSAAKPRRSQAAPRAKPRGGHREEAGAGGWATASSARPLAASPFSTCHSANQPERVVQRDRYGDGFRLLRHDGPLKQCSSNWFDFGGPGGDGAGCN